MILNPSIALLRTQSDERLVALARDGSEPAFQAIVERHRRPVLRACRRILPEARAEDAVQQVFIAAWSALGRGVEVREAGPWLLRIARNTSLNALRVQGYDYDELADGLSAGEAPQAQLERRDVIRQTLAGLAALPERQREALLRQAVEGASHADIARDLGLTEGATRQLLLRARTTLRAAATAVTPWPLVSWLAADGSRGGVERIAEAAAGGGAAGATALVAKAGTVAVLATGIVAGPAVVDRATHGDIRVKEARAAEPAASANPARAAVSSPAPVATEAARPAGSATGTQTVAGRATRRNAGEESGKRADRDERGSHRGRRAGDEPESREDDDDNDDSRPQGSDDDDSSNRGPGSGSGSRRDHPESPEDESDKPGDSSGHGSGDDRPDDPEPAETPETDVTPSTTTDALETPDPPDEPGHGNSGPGGGDDDSDPD